MFLAGAVFGALSCFARADYNLPLYSFLYIMWDQDDVSNLFNFWLEWQAEADGADGTYILGRSALDAVLGSTLVEFGDG